MMSTQLQEAVRRLASSSLDQTAYLESAGTAPSADELALEFSDALLLEQSSLVEPLRSLAVRLDEQLGSMSGPGTADLWTTEALHRAEEWVRVRELATRILIAVGENLG